jgi:hypothetical protein
LNRREQAGKTTNGKKCEFALNLLVEHITTKYAHCATAHLAHYCPALPSTTREPTPQERFLTTRVSDEAWNKNPFSESKTI